MSSRTDHQAGIYCVGGAVRDRLLDLPVQDHDWVVVGSTPEEMEARGYRPVGRDFPVFLHPETHEEYALARTERKTAPGYRGFVVHAAPDVTLEQFSTAALLMIFVYGGYDVVPVPAGEVADTPAGARAVAALGALLRRTTIRNAQAPQLGATIAEADQNVQALIAALGASLPEEEPGSRRERASIAAAYAALEAETKDPAARRAMRDLAALQDRELAARAASLTLYRQVLAQTDADATSYRFPLCVLDAVTAKDAEIDKVINNK